MSQADGSIIIDTEIDADGMKAGSKEVEAHMRKIASTVDDLGIKAKTALNKQVDTFVALNREVAAQKEKVESLKAKVAEYGKQKIPTQEYKEIKNSIEEANEKMNRLMASQKKFIDLGGSVDSKQYKSYQYDIYELANAVKYAKGELKDLEESGKAFTLGNKTDKAVSEMEKLASESQKLSNMNDRLNTSYSGIKGQVEEYKKSLLKTDSAQKKTSVSGKKLNKSLRDTGKAAKSAQFGIGKMLGTSLLFSFVFRAISAATQAIKDGFTNLAQYSSSTNNSISMLWSSLERLKNSLATAFAPILDIVAPILSKFIDMISTAASYVSMFFAFLSGKSTYTKAIAVQKDYAGSLNETASGAKDAAEETEAAADAAEDYLSPLDDINRYTAQDSGGGNSGNGAGGGNEEGIPEGPFFEEVEITDIPILQKVKDTLSNLFKPFKEAWHREGKNTIEAARYALTNLGSLAKSVGNSLMEVWTNGTGTEILSTMLRIAQQVLILVGNIAARLKEAWETNSVGTRIVQAIADIAKTILNFVEKIVQATADWAANLDFYPLLESIARLLESMQPIIKAIGDFLYKIYTTIILPVAKFLIETALPAIINALSGLFEFLGKHQWIIEAVGAALVGAFAVSKIVPLISTIVTAIKGLITIFGNKGLIGVIGKIISTVAKLVPAIGSVISVLGGPLTLAIIAVIAVGVLLITHWDEIKAAAAELAEQIKEKWELIKITTELVLNSIKEKASEIWSDIQSIFQNFDDFLSNIFSQDFQEQFGIMGDILEGFWSGVENIWSGIKNTFNGIIDFIKNVFTLNWKGAWQSVIDIFSGIFETLGGIVTTPLNTIIGAVNTVIRAISAGLNAVIRMLNRIHFTIPSWVPVFGGSDFGFNLPPVTAPMIPYLASGAVIPPNKEFMAVLGDQKHGNNIEAPEGLIRRIVREETGGAGGNKYDVNVKVGRRELLKITIDEAKKMQMQTGRNPFELA